jgi:hypothetical protein
LQQLTIEFVYEFIRENKIELKSTHGKLCFPIINRIYRKMSVGIKFKDIKTDGDLIIDGHHRFLASLLANRNLYKKSNAFFSLSISKAKEFFLNLSQSQWL